MIQATPNLSRLREECGCSIKNGDVSLNNGMTIAMESRDGPGNQG